MREPGDHSYLRLSQFLDLAAHWQGARDEAELAHRICRTMSLLLETPHVALGLGSTERRYRIVASGDTWTPEGAEQDILAASLLSAARTRGVAQVRANGSDVTGVFPFRLRDGSDGCLHVRLGRSMFTGLEIAFLQFLASIAGVLLGGLPRPAGTEPESAGVEKISAGHSSSQRFVAMAVHDLRNPLNVLAGYSRLLADGALGPLSEEQASAVGAIVRQVDVLTNTVEQILELERLSHNGPLPKSDTFCLSELFEELRDTCFHDQGARVAWPGAEARFSFTTNRRSLRAIVQNLVDNALRHTHTERVVVDCSRAAGTLIVAVRDLGPGIAADVRQWMERHAQTGSEPPPAAGLGLYAIATHVHLLGGTLEVEQPEGGGTRIRVRIPSPAPAGSSTNREAATETFGAQGGERSIG